MDNRLIQIEEKLDDIDQKIVGLACFGRLTPKEIVKSEKLVDDLTEAVQRLHGRILKDETQEWFNVKETAIYLGYSEAHIQTLLNEGALKGKRVGSERTDGKDPWTMARVDLEEFERKRRKPRD